MGNLLWPSSFPFCLFKKKIADGCIWCSRSLSERKHPFDHFGGQEIRIRKLKRLGCKRTFFTGMFVLKVLIFQKMFVDSDRGDLCFATLHNLNLTHFQTEPTRSFFTDPLQRIHRDGDCSFFLLVNPQVEPHPERGRRRGWGGDLFPSHSLSLTCLPWNCCEGRNRLQRKISGFALGASRRKCEKKTWDKVQACITSQGHFTKVYCSCVDLESCTFGHTFSVAMIFLDYIFLLPPLG